MKLLRKLLPEMLVIVLIFYSFSGSAFAVEVPGNAELVLAIENAANFNNNSIAGTLGGRYPQAAKDALSSAITAAKLVAENKTASEKEISNAIVSLEAATATYKEKRIGAPWDAFSQYISDKTPVVKREFRASWVATVANMDWPSKASASIADTDARVAQQKMELLKILDEAAGLKMNAVIFQVRPASDSFYKSELSPWSYYLTGKLNGEPGFDPLAFAIEEAHARNIELHAWFNPYRVSMTASGYGLKNLGEVRQMLAKEPKSVYAKHPEWVKAAQDRLVLDPGIPAARAFVEDSIMEVVNNYDIDAIHIDDYFYIGETGGSDGITDTDTYALYNNGEFSNIKDWRRGNTQKLVENISKKIKAAKPWVKWGVSPAGVWRNKADDPKLGSNTKAGLPNYDHAYADTRKWVLENTIDYIIPQIYWSFDLPAAGYGIIAEWWAETLKNNPSALTQLYIGQALYRLTESTTDLYFKVNDGEGYREIERQMKYNIARPEISGSVLFRHGNISDSACLPIINKIKSDIWATYSLVPAMKQLGGTAPAAPELVSVTPGENGNTLIWNDKETNKNELVKTKYYAIYRVSADADMNIEDAKNIIAIVNNSGEVLKYIDKLGTTGHKYAVTALNRLHDESNPSNIVSANLKTVVESIRFNSPLPAGTAVGRPITYSATISPENAMNKNVNWSSSNDEVASIDKNGVITPKKPGVVNITAQSEDNPEIKVSAVFYVATYY